MLHPYSITATSACRFGLIMCYAAIVVTPEMHRVHHSIERRERDSNFGFNLPWWDRLFGLTALNRRWVILT